CATRAATSWPTMDGTPDRSNTILATGRLLRRFATRRSRRIGLRISGKIEKSAPADANGRAFAGNGKGPPGGPQNNLGPIFAIQTIPWYAQWLPSPTSCTCYRFRVGPRTSQSVRARLRVRETRCTGVGRAHASPGTTRVHQLSRSALAAWPLAGRAQQDGEH